MEKKLQNKLIDALRNKLSTDYIWAAKALVRIYKNQTADERACGITIKHNGIGFNANDAHFGTDLAKQAMNWFNTPKEQRSYAYPLSPRQSEYACKMAKRYAKQIANIMLSENLEACYSLLGIEMPKPEYDAAIEAVVENVASQNWVKMPE